MSKVIFTAVLPPDATSGARDWVIITEKMWNEIQLINQSNNEIINGI